jgi:hypothetical protein
MTYENKNYLVFEATSQFDNKVFVTDGKNITENKAKVICNKILELFSDRIDPKLMTQENLYITIRYIKERICAYTQIKHNTNDISCRNDTATRHYDLNKLINI